MPILKNVGYEVIHKLPASNDNTPPGSQGTGRSGNCDETSRYQARGLLCINQPVISFQVAAARGPDRTDVHLLFAIYLVIQYLGGFQLSGAEVLDYNRMCRSWLFNFGARNFTN